ncbi:hypothetical protein AC578_9122 [Pseudocercospora eumusae]|uniref:Uncharacterized protein n=1 Tax=Pseudocercospora eumusae TaxID=321146 RepID=A0A139HVG1_9PEZI|nr:hypothetical protein AC578_9122 [Pseudocercospora eumusae]
MAIASEALGDKVQFLKRCLGRVRSDLETPERNKKDTYDSELYPQAARHIERHYKTYAAPPGETVDQPLYALCRLYERFLLDYVTAYRDELEHFLRKKDWRICDLPDPKDDDPARRAFLAGINDLSLCDPSIAR